VDVVIGGQMDVVIGLSYLVIPVAIWRLSRTVELTVRTASEDRAALLWSSRLLLRWLAPSFILLCGVSHLMKAWSVSAILWSTPLTAASDMVRAATACVSSVTAAFLIIYGKEIGAVLCRCELHQKGQVDMLVRELKVTCDDAQDKVRDLQVEVRVHSDHVQGLQRAAAAVERFEVMNERLEATTERFETNTARVETLHERMLANTRGGDLFRLLESLLTNTARSVNTLIAFVEEHNNMISASSTNIDTSLFKVRLLRAELNSMLHQMTFVDDRVFIPRPNPEEREPLSLCQVLSVQDLAITMIELLGPKRFTLLSGLNHEWGEAIEFTLCHASLSGPPDMRRGLRLAGIKPKTLLPPMQRSFHLRNRRYLLTPESRIAQTLREAERSFAATDRLHHSAPED